MRTMTLAIALLLLWPSVVVSQDIRDEFLGALASSVMGSDSIYVRQPDLGWEGIALASLGASVEPILQAYSGEEGDVFQLAANTEVFGRPINIVNGRVTFNARSLVDVWGAILRRSTPPSPVLRDRALPVPVMRWLFSPLLRSGNVVGYSREPSQYVKRYREYQAAYQALHKARDNDVWKLIPRLNKYDTFEEAEVEISSEWIKSGYKIEIESALKVFEAHQNPVDWDDWVRVNDALQRGLKPISFHQKLPLTYLVPPPASWSTVSSWRRAVHRVPEMQGEYRFQWSEIKILRPWFDPDALVSREIHLQPSTSPFVVSAGNDPSAGGSLEGVLPGYVDSLILVRDIEFYSPQDAAAPPPDRHPLAAFAYPESINLLGYRVKLLPNIEGELLSEAPDVE